MRARIVYIAVAVVAAGALVAVLIARRKPVPGPAPKQTAAVQADTPNEFTLQGKVRPQNIVGVAPNVTGFIEAFLVEPGQDVYQGQVLARIGSQGLESARENAAVALERAQEQANRLEAGIAAARMEASRAEADAQRAQIAFERAEKTFNRQRTLFSEGATPRLAFQKAETDYQAAQKEHEIMENAARAGREHVQSALNQVAAARNQIAARSRELDDAQAELAAAEIRSPVDGYVVSRKGEVGKPADGIGEDFFRIATDLYALEIELEPKAEEAKRLIPGMPALVLVLDVQAGAMEGKVKEIKDGKAIVEFGSANPAIKPGMLADVRFRFQ